MTLDLRSPKQIRRERRAAFAAIALGFLIAGMIAFATTKASGHEIARQINHTLNCGAC
tara:strand:- start:389 stop:562 length:174 start_codon:yes stop_codon:yes gene_type:complete